MIDLIKAATLSNIPEHQKSAEMTLVKHRQEQPQEFFLECAKIFNSKDVPPMIRQSTGILLTGSLKHKITTPLQINQVFLWSTLSVPSRSTFKDMVLNTMIDHQKVIRRAAANIVAAICCIEIPNNEWPGIAEKITQNIRSDDLIVKEVSILTIGFICEQLKEFQSCFEEPLQETILTGILMGVKDSHLEIAQTAFKALRDGLPALSSLMKTTQYRQYLISQIAQAIGSKNFVELGLQCLIEFVRCNYALLQPQYVQGFASLIDPIMQNVKEETNCVLAMEFWSTLAKEEIDIESNPNLLKFIAGPLADRLVQALLRNLCIIEENQEEANGISQSSASTLQAIFERDSVEHEKKILTFAQNTIRHENWKYRQASIRAFALLLIGLPQERSKVLVNNSLLSLVALLNDPHQYVQLSAIKSLASITQSVSQVILHHQKFFQILQFVVKMGHGGQNFLKYVCKIVDNLCTPEQSSTKILGPHSGNLIKHFLDTCLQPGRSVSLISSCLNVIINLIKCSCNVQICNSYIEYILTMYGNVHNLQKQNREMFYSGFFTIAQVCLITVQKVKGSITMDQLSSLYNLVVKHYTDIHDVEGDGYYVVSALIYFIPNDKRIINDFWKYIQYGLKKVNQEEIFKSTISCICDFAATYREQISEKVDPIINEILQLYDKNQITRELKLDILMCIGQLFLQCGETCIKHLNRVLTLLLQSIKGSFQVNDQNYAQILQESIIETLMCIYHVTNDSLGKEQLVNFLPYVLEFVKLTTDKGKHPKLDYVKDCLMFLADISSLYPIQKSKILQAGFINDRTAILIKFNNDGHLNQNIQYIKQQFHLNL